MSIHKSSQLGFRICTANLSAKVRAYRKYLLLLGLPIVVGALRPANAQNVQALPNATPISQCGTTISKPGSYEVTQQLQSSSDTADCIRISSPGVLLSISGKNLIGPGGVGASSAGIDILKSAYGVQVFFDDATIEGFGIGISVEASGVSLASTNNGFTVKGNAAQGVLISNASNVQISGLTSNGNGAAGLELFNTTGVIVQGFSLLESNGTYGLWLHSSSGNQFFNVESSDNKADGIFVGETINTVSAVEPFRGGGELKSIEVSVPSKNNGFVGGALIHNGSDGISIGMGDSFNVVTVMQAQANSGKDAVDQNPGCGENIWSGNRFQTTNSSCIH